MRAGRNPPLRFLGWVQTVSESESIASRSSHGSGARSAADELLPELTARANPEREGLPRNYRMRADAHYVDQLESPATPVIRLVKTAQIDASDLPAATDVEALTQSIATCGILQPLLVRRHGGRYSLINGRKRLAAAIGAGLTAVPCVLHDVEGAAAAALDEAANLRVGEPPVRDEGADDRMRPLLEALATDLATIRNSISLLRVTRGGALSQKVGADLIESQAARAAWLLDATSHVSNDDRLVPLGAIIQRVVDGFHAHESLMGLQLDVSVTPQAAVWKLPEAALVTAINGAIFGTLALIEGVQNPKLEVHADALHGRTLKIEVVQRAMRVMPGILASLDSEHAADPVAAVALRTARQVVTSHGGAAEISALPGSGSVLQMTFVNPLVAG